MKRIIVTLFVMSLVAMSSCNKTSISNNPGPLPENYALTGISSSKDGNNPIEITYRIGHTASECGNACIIMNGVPSHADCQGSGNACVVRLRLWPIGGQPKSNTFSALVDSLWDPTAEDFFLTPNRSLLFIDGNNSRIYLNIPEQLVYRDTITKQFTFTRLFFSDTAAFSNY